ncbi:hypothetical protein ZIOFF_013039 [Zingiber officinale]|uniref:DDE Tnp4 domain-containing protein n=1 Tax=Zingiber officinale TaxID=94328 RepID=A0A8J5LTW2_ZINOF|nr:hypothetical protein ZIOFF_013039 [Zingiber officinale]
MGPVRGFRQKKKKKRVEKLAATAADPPPQGSGDWWDEFSSRISAGSLLIDIGLPVLLNYDEKSCCWSGAVTSSDLVDHRLSIRLFEEIASQSTLAMKVVPLILQELVELGSRASSKCAGKVLRLNGENLKLPGGSEVQEYVIRDAGFPLLPRLLTPYRGKDLSHAEVEFNSRLTANGILAQRAFARLKDMWKIIHGEMWRPDWHRLLRIILVCCLLHNIAIDMEDEVIYTMPFAAHEHDANYKQQFFDIEDDKGTTLQDRLYEYLSGGLGLPS